MDRTEMSKTKAITAAENPSNKEMRNGGHRGRKGERPGRKPDYLKRLGDYSGGAELSSAIADLPNHAKIPR